MTMQIRPAVGISENERRTKYQSSRNYRIVKTQIRDVLGLRSHKNWGIPSARTGRIWEYVILIINDTERIMRNNKFTNFRLLHIKPGTTAMLDVLCLYILTNLKFEHMRFVR